MAFPQVAAYNGGAESANAVDHTINLPSGISAGHLLLIIIASDGTPTFAWPSGWTQIFQTAVGCALGACYRVADGTEGSSVTVTTSAEQVSYVTYRITGHSSSTNAPQGGTSATGTSTLPDPPNLTPTGGAKDYLWIALEGNDHSDLVSAYPANYANGLNYNGGIATSCGVGVARRELNAASENPGIFTLAGSEEWVANTIAVHPGSEGTATAVGDTVQEVWNIRQVISDTNQLIYHVRAVLGDTSQSIWNTRVAIGDIIQHIWNTNSLATKSIQLVHNVLAAIGDTSQYIWNVLVNATAVGDIVELVWHARGTVGNTIQNIWNIRAFITKTSQVVWNILTILGDTTQMIWNVKGLMADELQGVWNVLTSLGKTSQPIWNILSIVGDTISNVWNVRTLVYKTVQTIHNIYATIGHVSQYVWNVLEAVTAVGKTFELVWNTRMAIGKTIQPLWNVLIIIMVVVGNTFQSLWNIRFSYFTPKGKDVKYYNPAEPPL